LKTWYALEYWSITVGITRGIFGIYDIPLKGNMVQSRTWTMVPVVLFFVHSGPFLWILDHISRVWTNLNQGPFERPKWDEQSNEFNRAHFVASSNQQLNFKLRNFSGETKNKLITFIKFYNLRNILELHYVTFDACLTIKRL
jgi:hypothetical protein